MTVYTATALTPAPRDGLLRSAIRADSLFCAIGGALTLALAGQLPAFFGTGIPAFYLGMGATLLIYAGFLLWLASRPTISRRAALVPIVLCILWVIDSAIVLLSGWLPFTTAGFWTIVVIGDLVLALGVVQYLGLRRASA